MFPALIASDLDGTLLRSDGSLSERAREALAACEAAGALIVLCTARPVRWVRPLASELGGRPVAACDNGAVTWALAGDRRLAARTLQAGAAETVVTAVTDVLPGGAWATEWVDGFGHERQYLPHWPVPEGTAVDHISTLVREPVVKLMFRHAGFRADEMLGPARRAVGDHAEVTHSNSAGDLLEISAPGVSKATALQELCRERSIPPEAVLAFGDMPNDLAMLSWAGRAVAVAGAHPDVIAVADELTLGNDDDGVAVVLERMLGDARMNRPPAHIDG